MAYPLTNTLAYLSAALTPYISKEEKVHNVDIFLILKLLLKQKSIQDT
jgi:hypothetical protein